ncbi:hypothetical protein ESP57_07670 [Agromyces fucosus]|uniref:Uncharacterized protein n=1 Tax=Agromyces fucosus TaxID=41985 RepID=A0A4Q2JL40_9MICO|nr:hypothetical protein [Agromyces fucosus]RXZ48851.1 hypothetical protein ESP57_07670 [Agromyces fucosus]
MADFMRYLPLSQGDRARESDVSSDWRDATADVIDRAAVLLEAAELDDDAGTRLAEGFLESVSTRRHPAPGPTTASDAATPDSAHPAAAAPADRLRGFAVAIRLGRPARISFLSRAVAAHLMLAHEVGTAPALPERTSGAVALYLAAKAPTPIRAVINGHTLRASDADWEFGHGPVLEQAAIPMLEFLLGRSLEAPRPAAGDRG